MLATTTLFGQDVSKKAIYGTYYKQDGLPGRTIAKSDSSEIHLMPVIYSTTYLKIKRFSRAKLTTVDFRMNNMKTTFKYKWKLENDTLIIWAKNAGTEEKYKMVLDRGYVLYLEAVMENRRGYSR